MRIAASKALWIHLGIVAGCFVVSLGVTRAIDPFAGPSTPDLIMGMLAAVMTCHVIAAILAFYLHRIRFVSVLLIAAICLLPAAFFLEQALSDAVYLKYYAVWDRFRDNLADPVPQSVARLRLTTLEEMIDPDLCFSFEIDPQDLRAIISSKGLKLVKPDELSCPRDYFKYPYYLPMPGSYLLYQGRDLVGNVVTLKANEAHDRAIVRIQSENFACDSARFAYGQEQLETMKMQWEASPRSGKK